jgi:hypothetical protein
MSAIFTGIHISFPHWRLSNTCPWLDRENEKQENERKLEQEK